MTRPTILLAALAALALAAGLFLRSDGASQPPAVEASGGAAKALLTNPAGAPVGVAKLTEEGGEVRVRVSVEGLPAGFHGFHVHTTGNCLPFATPPLATDPFGSAAGHFNPGGVSHGSHAGDLPVLLVNADGTGEATFDTDRFAVADLLAGDGSAFIIHANPDNYANIPARYLAPPATITAVDAATLGTGDAGGRIACGVIERG